MSAVRFENVGKEYPGNVQAVEGLTLDVGEGEFLILVGPSGCGKTTALRMVAGLEEVTSGRILIGDRVVNDLPPTARDVAMVFQNYALYPHMTVADNIAFPLRQQKVRRADRVQRVVEVAQLLSIEELLERRPRELSGGQRQRVAIGRALVRRPQVFLMDEPLSNLDAKLRVQMRAELISLHQRVGITTIYVTHDQTEAMTLGDRVVVMQKGIVQQVDKPERLYRRPSNLFVAGFIGSPAMNFFEGMLAGGNLELGRHPVELPADVRDALVRRDGPVIVGVRPEDLRPAAPGAPAIHAEVTISEQLGPEVLVHVRMPELTIPAMGERAAKTADEESGELSSTAVARFEPDWAAMPGDQIGLTVEPKRVHLFDRETGMSLLPAG